MKTTTPPAKPRHAAFVRGDDGNLSLRRFAAAADAAAASSAHRELPAPAQIAAVMGGRRGEMKSTDLARELGVHPRTIRRAYARGALPGAKEHGERLLFIPTALYRLAQAYGLRGLERMAKAGLL